MHHIFILTKELFVKDLWCNTMNHNIYLKYRHQSLMCEVHGRRNKNSNWNCESRNQLLTARSKQSDIWHCKNIGLRRFCIGFGTNSKLECMCRKLKVNCSISFALSFKYTIETITNIVWIHGGIYTMCWFLIFNIIGKNYVLIYCWWSRTHSVAFDGYVDGYL